MGPGNTAVKEKFQLKDALGSIHVLIGSDSANGGFMHLHFFGNLPQRQRLEFSDTIIKKIFLKINDTFSDSIDGFLSLVNTFNKPNG